jgi:hypothetical protein
MVRVTTDAKRLIAVGAILVCCAFVVKHAVGRNNSWKQELKSSVATSEEIRESFQEAEARLAEEKAMGNQGLTEKPAAQLASHADTPPQVEPPSSTPVAIAPGGAEMERLQSDLAFDLSFAEVGSPTSFEYEHNREGYATWAVANKGSDAFQDVGIEIRAGYGVRILDQLTDGTVTTGSAGALDKAVWQLDRIIPGTPDPMIGYTGAKGGRLQFKVEAFRGEQIKIEASVHCHGVTLTITPALTVYVK